MARAEYIGERYVPQFAQPSEVWNSDLSYDPLTIVRWTTPDDLPALYVSKTYVPANVSVWNTRYWSMWSGPGIKGDTGATGPEGPQGEQGTPGVMSVTQTVESYDISDPKWWTSDGFTITSERRVQKDDLPDTNIGWVLGNLTAINHFVTTMENSVSFMLPFNQHGFLTASQRILRDPNGEEGIIRYGVNTILLSDPDNPGQVHEYVAFEVSYSTEGTTSFTPETFPYNNLYLQNIILNTV